MTVLTSPYSGARDLRLRGNLHAHSTVSDGESEVGEVIADYEGRGYDFLAVSDHDAFVDPEEYREETSMTLLPAVEVSDGGPHLLHLGATEAVAPAADRQAVLDAIGDRDGTAIVAHPKWRSEFAHWPPGRLRELSGYHGIEIYNGLIEGHPGAALATDRWDRLLSSGRRVWGFANDDSHCGRDVGRAWNVVFADEVTPRAITEALRVGRFYASTGVAIHDVQVADGVITVETDDASLIRLVSDHGLVQQSFRGPTATFRVPEHVAQYADQTYLRIECFGRGTDAAWTQPLFLED